MRTLEQRVAAIEALLSTVLTTQQSIQSTLAADRQTVFTKAFERVQPDAVGPVRVP